MKLECRKDVLPTGMEVGVGTSVDATTVVNLITRDLLEEACILLFCKVGSLGEFVTEMNTDSFTRDDVKVINCSSLTVDVVTWNGIVEDVVDCNGLIAVDVFIGTGGGGSS